MASPLFAHAAKALQNQAIKSFQGTDIGQLLSQANGITAAARSNPARLSKMLNKFRNFNPNNLAKYAKKAAAPENLVDAFLSIVSPGMGQTAAKLLRGVMTGKGGTGSGGGPALDAAIQVAQSFGFEVLPPPAARKGKLAERGEAAALEFLQNLGYQIPAKGDEFREVELGKQPRRRLPQDRRPQQLKGLAKDHDLITGKFFSTPSSSNVFSAGYAWESETLYVRFRTPAPKNQQGGAGPLYRYRNIDAASALHLFNVRGGGGGRFDIGDIFAAAERADDTPGTWVWTHLRIRGSVAGHRKPYELIGVTGNHVPRQATIISEDEAPRYGLEGAGQVFLKRGIHTRSGRMLESRASNAMVRQWPQPYRAEPNRGTPAEPNRGTPNRGR